MFNIKARMIHILGLKATKKKVGHNVVSLVGRGTQF